MKEEGDLATATTTWFARSRWGGWRQRLVWPEKKGGMVVMVGELVREDKVVMWLEKKMRHGGQRMNIYLY